MKKMIMFLISLVLLLTSCSSNGNSSSVKFDKSLNEINSFYANNPFAKYGLSGCMYDGWYKYRAEVNLTSYTGIEKVENMELVYNGYMNIEFVPYSNTVKFKEFDMAYIVYVNGVAIAGTKNYYKNNYCYLKNIGFEFEYYNSSTEQKDYLHNGESAFFKVEDGMYGSINVFDTIFPNDFSNISKKDDFTYAYNKGWNIKMNNSVWDFKKKNNSASEIFHSEFDEDYKIMKLHREVPSMFYNNKVDYFDMEKIDDYKETPTITPSKNTSVIEVDKMNLNVINIDYYDKNFVSRKHCIDVISKDIITCYYSANDVQSVYCLDIWYDIVYFYYYF